MKKEEFFRNALPDSVGPLEGVRVLEATHNFAGPNVGTVLADLGADSVKCDPPGMGDILRHLPPFVDSEQPLETGAQHLSINRNKRDITLNLRHHEGQALFRRLAQGVDIVVENFKPGTMAGWGLGYEEICRVKPDIIYVSVSGFGQFGPYHERPSYDAVGQAMGGLMYVTGQPDGPPTRPGFGLGDSLAGWQGALAALAALHYRNRTGKGQHIDISQIDTILYLSESGILLSSNLNRSWERIGSGHPLGAPYNAYQCPDGHVFIGIVLDSHWKKFCQIAGREELIEDPRSRTTTDRAQHRELVDGAVSQWVRDKKVSQVVDALVEAGLVVAPIYSFPQIVRDEHIREREMVTEVEHPAAGKIDLYGVAAKFSLTPARVRRPAPMMGQHNQEVYGERLGLSAEELRRLQENGAI
ncbi:MAG: CoA transferase [Nitrospinae bacterium]|nr:CoA transferase [Nitrospinota bacterium]